MKRFTAEARNIVPLQFKSDDYVGFEAHRHGERSRDQAIGVIFVVSSPVQLR